MKLSFLTLVLSFVVSSSMAQVSFENVYKSGALRVLEELDDGRIFSNLAYNSNVNVDGFSTHFNDGVVQNSQAFFIDTMLVIQAIRHKNSHELFFASAYWKDSCSTFGSSTIKFLHPFIGRADSAGNLLSAYYYNLNSPNCGNMTRDFNFLKHNGAILWGSSTSMFFPSMFLLQIDSLFNPLWAKTFSNHGEVAFVKETPNGHLLAGFELDTAGASIVKLDSTGNILWAHSYFPDGIIKDCIIESDSSYIVTGYTQHYTALGALPTNYQPQLFIMKLNQDGQVLWCKGYDSAPSSWYTQGGQRIEPTLDGNYVVLGNLGNTGFNSGRYPFLMKTDLNGDSLWTATAGGKYSSTYRTTDLLAVSDGGFMFGGLLFGAQPQVFSSGAFIYKTDSMGKLPCLSSWHPTVMNTLFPTDSAIALSWSSGATRHPAFVTDTIFEPIVHYDACLVTNDVPSYSTNRRRFRVRPNPNAGQFTVSFEHPLQANSFYSVYDELGRLLFERPLRKGTQIEDIDLRGFGKGLYLVKLTEGDSVLTERVVVE